ncbi:hypothetical protein [Thermocoleostomius sinensis]|uniref:Uncharacterized protein n=1 Tax=Thermocoleostomius sinensis A174 TaxID=2016057 RepID=A0A9E8ZGI9_9CYAN|nr:hypothetical protein [Thermocoleostomius sinensis]WAL61424.1 hypothetical protein OXH18_05385 [Thermocoleostomius sinensis A174]
MDIGSVWTQILTALVVGLLTAFAFQFLLTSLGIAIGLSVWSLATPDRSESLNQDTQSNSRSNTPSADSSQLTGQEPRGASGIGTMAGFSILLTVNFVLFVACFLAAKFSQAVDPIAGAIEGVVVWSAYFLLLIWLSSTAMSSVVGAIVGATTGGFRQLLSTIGTALSRSETEALPTDQQLLALQQEMQEMQAVLDPENLRQLLETQLQSLPPDPFPHSNASLALKTTATKSSATTSDIAIDFWQQVESYLQIASPKALAPKRFDRQLQNMWQATQAKFESHVRISTNPNLDQFYDRDALHQILEQRHDLSDKKKTRLLDQLQETWTDFLNKAEPEAEVSTASEETKKTDDSDGTTQSSIAQLTTKLMQSASEASLEQLLANLPTLLQWLKTTMPAEMPSLVPLILSIALDKIRSSMTATNLMDAESSTPNSSNHEAHAPSRGGGSLINYVTLRQSLNQLLESSSELASFNQSLVTQLEAWRDRSLQQVDLIQQAAQDRLHAAKQQTQQRLDETRRAAATAAWWLVMTATTGVVSSALAGALAANFDLRDLLFWW